jgi:ribosomal protein S18 acetylase RimI-like enzyme
MTINPLDNPVWHALAGPHRVHAAGRGLALHYPLDITPFSALAEPSMPAYADLAADLPPRTEARLFRPSEESLPQGWEQIDAFPMLQMIASDAPSADIGRTALLQESNGPAMMELVSAARPGPFGLRTPVLGRYLGVWHEGRLIAMAGERLRVPGHVELSGICVHPDARGKGHAAALTSALMRLALDGGELPFLHVRPDNVAAVGLYRRLGFRVRRELVVLWRRPR